MVPSVDTSDFPIVRLIFGPTLTREDVCAHHRAMQALLRTRGPFIVISDINAVVTTQVSAAVRKEIARVADEIASEGGLIAELVVVNSSVVRVLFTIYALLRRVRSHPLRAFNSTADAYVYARALLEEQRTPPPAEAQG